MQAQAMVDATRRSRHSDVSAGFLGRNYSGNGDFRQAEFMLSFSLPIFNAKKYRADLRRDEARLKTTELETTDYELSVREEVHNLTVKIDAARREALVYQDEIIPRSESALASARAAWESGRGHVSRCAGRAADAARRPAHVCPRRERTIPDVVRTRPLLRPG